MTTTLGVAPTPTQNPLVNEMNPNNILTSNEAILNEINQHQFSLLSLNIRSLNKNINHLRHLVSKVETDLIALCEIFKPLESYVQIPGYQFIMKTQMALILEELGYILNLSIHAGYWIILTNLALRNLKF